MMRVHRNICCLCVALRLCSPPQNTYYDLHWCVLITATGLLLPEHLATKKISVIPLPLVYMMHILFEKASWLTVLERTLSRLRILPTDLESNRSHSDFKGTVVALIPADID